MRELRSRRRSTAFFTAITVSGLLALIVFASTGCGGSSTSEAEPGTTTTTPAKPAIPVWPDVPVSLDTLKAAVTPMLGIQIAPKIIALRDVNAEQTSPGRFSLTVRYNQPGMCHSAGPVKWQASILQQYGFTLLSILYKHPQVDRVTIEAYATADSTIDDPQQFEKVSRFVVDRARLGGISWDAERAYVKLPSIATEYWITPKAV